MILEAILSDDTIVGIVWGAMTGMVLIIIGLIRYIWSINKSQREGFEDAVNEKIDKASELVYNTSTTCSLLQQSVSNLNQHINKFNGSIDKLIENDKNIHERLHAHEKEIIVLKNKN